MLQPYIESATALSDSPSTCVGSGRFYIWNSSGRCVVTYL